MRCQTPLGGLPKILLKIQGAVPGGDGDQDLSDLFSHSSFLLPEEL